VDDVEQVAAGVVEVGGDGPQLGAPGSRIVSTARV
jgi:hypothetical protein